ncbi:MAG: hypothetical protein ONB30_02035 [candidate division KSB1 bacterium]|nr:hypothetical protein [candidate division KSB1 bacterium]
MRTDKLKRIWTWPWQEEATPREVFRWVKVLFWGNMIAIPASALLYGERFDAVSYPLSWLGNPATVNGLPNQRGMLVFDANLLLSAVVCVRLGKLMWRSGKQLIPRAMAALFFAAALGLVVALVPCATHDPIHRLGAGLMTTSLWLLGFALLWQTYRYAHGIWFYLLVVMNHLLLYIYAVLFFANRPSQTLAQKGAFFGLLCNLYIPARAALAQAGQEEAEPELTLEVGQR